MTDTNNGTWTKWEGKWDQLVGKAKETWGEVGDNDWSTIAEGKYDQLVGKIKEWTGTAEEEIERRLND